MATKKTTTPTKANTKAKAKVSVIDSILADAQAEMDEAIREVLVFKAKELLRKRARWENAVKLVDARIEKLGKATTLVQAESFCTTFDLDRSAE